eukprot:scaffold28336_cov69-Phaeocystis_antarctica.AAC.3
MARNRVTRQSLCPKAWFASNGPQALKNFGSENTGPTKLVLNAVNRVARQSLHPKAWVSACEARNTQRPRELPEREYRANQAGNCRK